MKRSHRAKVVSAQADLRRANASEYDFRVVPQPIDELKIAGPAALFAYFRRS
jgi:hypothetical protein